MTSLFCPYNVLNQERKPKQPDGDSSDNVLKKWIRAVSNLIAVISIHLDVSNVGKIIWSCIYKDYVLIQLHRKKRRKSSSCPNVLHKTREIRKFLPCRLYTAQKCGDGKKCIRSVTNTHTEAFYDIQVAVTVVVAFKSSLIGSLSKGVGDVDGDGNGN